MSHPRTSDTDYENTNNRNGMGGGRFRPRVAAGSPPGYFLVILIQDHIMFDVGLIVELRSAR